MTSLGLMLIAIVLSSLLKTYLISQSLYHEHTQFPHSVTESIILLVLISPILEELVFRTPTKISKNNIIIAICMGVILFGMDFKTLLAFKFSTHNMFVGLFSILLYFILIKTINEKHLTFLKKHPISFAYLLTLLFTISHIKYELHFLTIILFPLILLPQLTLGIVLTHFRIKYNTGVAIGIHLVMNTLVAIQLIT